MKIKTKIALRYSIITAVLMTIFAAIVYIVSAHDRETEFYDDLYKEGLSKANLFFEAHVAPDVLHSIYKNNIEYIDEVEVAIYDINQNLLYHDATEIDIVKETKELLEIIREAGIHLNFYSDKYQVVGFLFSYQGANYVITAAAYDGYGFNKLNKLAFNLTILCLFSILISFILGYFLAKRALQPVLEISQKMRNITANNLDLRLLNYKENDEIGELANSFNQALDIIEKSFDAQKMFVSNVSHELRTPLAALIGEIDLALLKTRTIEEYERTLKISKEDATRLIKIINGLLDFAKANYNQSEISISEVRLDEVLLDARENVIRGNALYNVDLQYDYSAEDEIEMSVLGNEYLLKTAFTNLIENNCKYSENHTSVVKIASSEDKLIVSFSDNGIGIPEIDLKNVLKPFYRGLNKDIAYGSGIGLALVDKVILMHKGTFIIKSEVGQGTSFIIELPCL